MEGKGGKGGLSEGRERRRKERHRRGRRDGAEPHVIEKLQAARDLLAGKQSSVVGNLPNVGTQFINIMCCVFFCMGILG